MSANGSANGALQLNLQLEQANQLLQQGQIQPAVQLCQTILAQDETCAPAYSIMGDILRHMGNFTSAEKFLDLALKFDEHNPAYRIQKSQALYSQERAQDALVEIDAVIARSPQLAVAHLLRGDYLIKLKRYDDALAAFDRVGALEDMPGLNEHYGLCYMVMGKHEIAEKQFQQTIDRTPEFFRPYFLIGQIRLESGDEKAAEEYFDKALERNPSDSQSWSGKGAIARARKDDGLAYTCFQRAIQSNPLSYHPYYLLGTFLQQSRRLSEAEPLLRKCLTLKPDFLPAETELALNLYNTNRKEEALAHIDAVLAEQPDNDSFRHMRAGITGESPSNAPASYVSGLFNDYAEMFEHHLVSVLDYHIPEKARDALIRIWKESGEEPRDLSLLDLGCGTGLGAMAFKDITGWRVGVDLSSKMIDKAREKGMYDTLAVADVVEYLEQSRRGFDLITTFDVVVYIGDLAPLFKNARAKLNDGGYFAISVECGNDTGTYTLQPTTRYAHSAAYLESLAAEHGLKVAAKEATTIRTEHHEPIKGYLFIFQKNDSDSRHI